MESISGGSSTHDLEYTKKEIFEIFGEHFKSDLETQIQILEDNFSEREKIYFKFDENMKSAVKKILCNFQLKWKKSHYMKDRFYEKNEKWLQSSVTLKNARGMGKSSTTPSKAGRPSAEFENASDRSKRRKTEDVRSKLSTAELSYAAQMSLRSSGSVHAASIVKDITTSSPMRATKYKKAYEATATAPPITEMSADEALVDVVKLQLTKQQYKDLRNSLREKNVRIYPSYDKVLEAKTRCYPSDIMVTETCAEVKLQSLLNHTCDRILAIQKDVVTTLHPRVVVNLRCIVKWGCDGSSGQSEYKQKFNNDESSDSSIFLTSLVLLQIIGVDSKTLQEFVVWKNPRPSSTRFCRPIRLQFLKENVESTLNEKQYIQNQIESLAPFKICIDKKKVEVKFHMHFTMIDGKVCNAVTDTKSAMRCYLCGATSKEFNNIESMKKKVTCVEHLQLGLSTLHAWIRCFECLLHVGYKIGVNKWQSRNETDKELIKQRKLVIQTAFKKQLHLNIDCPKPGFGSTNDGNTARRFFENSAVSATILGVDKNLIRKFHTILQVMSSGFAIKIEEFRKYCLDTAELFVNLYSWFCMPTSVHKILIHGAQVIEWAPLPIGQLSEDAQEARNKDIKKYRANFSRKCSRENTMRDVFQRLLITSDPYISSMGKHLAKQCKSFSSEARALFFCSDGSHLDDSDDDDNE